MSLRLIALLCALPFTLPSQSWSGARSLIKEGKLAEAAVIVDLAYREAEAKNAHNAALAIVLEELAQAQTRSKSYAEAARNAELAAGIWARLFAADSARGASNLQLQGSVRDAEGDAAGARDCYERAAAMLERVFGPNHAAVAEAWRFAARKHSDAGRSELAETAQRRALEIAQALPQPSPMFRPLAGEYGDILARLGRDAEADFWRGRARAYSIQHVSGGGLLPPRLLSKVEPEYAPGARAMRLEGSVVLTLIVGTDGTPQNIAITRPLGGGLDEQAILAVTQWRFAPSRNPAGEPVAVAATVEVNFRLM